MFVNFNILNQLGSPAINSNTFANRPAAGQTGRLFVSTDTFEIYRDNGTTWDLIGGPGSSTITGTGTATQVAYFTAAQAIGSSANLFWDNTNTRLGVGTATPGYTLEVNGNLKTNTGIYMTGATAANGVLYFNGADNRVTLANYNAGGILAFESNVGAIQMNLDANGALVIGNGASSGNISSILELVSTTRGFLQPRMTTAQRNLIATPATGLTVYNTTSNTIDYYNGTSWISLSTTTGTVTGTGTATQVAFWDAASNITGSNNLFWNNTNGRLGINTATPGTSLDVHGTGTLQQLNTTGATANNYLAFQRTGTTTFSIGDTYNGGSNYFRIFGNSLSADILQIFAATGKSTLTATETYSTGVARGNYLQYTLTVPAGTSFSTPNAITAFGATLDFRPNGNATIPGGARTGLDARNSVSFTGAGTLTMTQPGTNTRAFSNLTTGWAFAGTAIGTITELAGLRVLFPDNSGSAINVTNNYALLINSQTANTGTITYTNRWGIYQEGASDLNYLAANLLIGSTTNSGEALQVTGTAKVTSTLTANSLVKSGGTASQILAADGSVITAGTNITIAAGTISASGGITGSGTTNYLPKFTAATTLGNSRFFDDGTTTFLGNGDINASPSTGIFSGTGGTGTNIAGAELRIRGGASTGNAAGGIISFYTSVAGSSGSGVNAATEAMRITSGGNVGIGTTSPITKLHASISYTAPTGGIDTNVQILTSNTSTGSSSGINMLSSNSGVSFLHFGDTDDANIGEISYTHVNDNMLFVTAANIRMRLDGLGNLGINTNTIGSRLQVNGNAAIGYSASTAAPTNGLAVSGRTLIGTTTDSYSQPLQVNGIITAQLPNSTNGNGVSIYATTTSANGSQPAVAYYNPSNSRRFYAYADVGTSDSYNIGNASNATIFQLSQTGVMTVYDTLTISDGKNIAVNTTTGTKIGTATSQKLAFWNATPIVQPTTAVAGAARIGGGGATVTDTDTFGGYTIAQVVQALRNTGILA